MTNDVMYALIVAILAINVRAIYNFMGVVTDVMELVDNTDDSMKELKQKRAKRLRRIAIESIASIAVGTVLVLVLFLFTQGG